MYKYEWYFEVNAKAGIATNLETGEDTSCLANMGLEFKEPKTSEQYESMKPVVRRFLAKQFDMPEEWIAMLSKEEYDSLSDEDTEKEAPTNNG